MRCPESNYAIKGGDVYIDSYSYMGTGLLNTSLLTHFNPIRKILLKKEKRGSPQPFFEHWNPPKKKVKCSKNELYVVILCLILMSLSQRIDQITTLIYFFLVSKRIGIWNIIIMV